MKKILLATIIPVAAAPGPSQAQQTTTKDQLIGSWKVLSLKAKYHYPHAFLATVRGCDSQVPAAPALTDAEGIAMMKTQVAWTGKYITAEQTAEGIKLTAHVDAASNRRSSTPIAYTSYESTATK
jgi:hypothetical protein